MAGTFKIGGRDKRIFTFFFNTFDHSKPETANIEVEHGLDKS